MGTGILLAAVLLLPHREMPVTWAITDGNRVILHMSVREEPEEILAEVAMGVGDTYDVSGLREIRIHREKKEIPLAQREQSYTVVLEPEEVRCFDPSLPEGTEVILREGRPGELACRALVTYTDGKEMSRILLEETVRRHPVNRIVAVGTGMRIQTAAKGPVIQNGLIFLPTGEVLTYDRVMTSLATAYCDKGLTATGTQARVGAIAVDPKVIPYGTRMFIVSKDGKYIYGIATAEDCGSKEHIYDTRIDLHFDTYEECRQFGARYCKVYFLS